jgi:DNA polymerase-3 subunit gamma/tau
MSYTVLARKYRSQTFDDLVGQGPLSLTLKNAIKTHHVAHAFLFSGTRGVGKTTMARILAKALNCHGFDEATTEPCCKCDSCIAINIGEDLDVIEIDGASTNGVEHIRELRQNAIYRPARSRYKIYIIDEIHMLSNSAFNALLKILEEPPEHVKFIFATTEPNKVIATIQSRCQRFDFANISSKDIAGHLASLLKLEKIEFDDDLVLSVAKMANGSMRDGLSLLDRLISTGVEPLTAELLEEYLGCPDSEKLGALVKMIADSDAAGTLQAADELTRGGLGEVQILDALVDYMRDLMIVCSAGADSELLLLTGSQKKQVTELAEKFDIAALVYNITSLERLRWTISNSQTPRALLEATLLRFALSEHFMNVDSLMSRLQGGGAKKKLPPMTRGARGPAPATEAVAPVERVVPKLDITDTESLTAQWKSVLNIIGEISGKAMAGLLSSVSGQSLEGDRLTLVFDAEASKNMCQNAGRREPIEAVLSQILGRKIKLVLALSAEKNADQSQVPNAGVSKEKKNKIMQDAAVKAIVTHLGATITGIETKD